MIASKQESSKTIFFLTATATILSLLLLLYIHLSNQNTVKKYIPWIDASMEIRLEVALAHLWFEEVISGDSGESIKSVHEHIDQAKWYAIAILDGGENRQGIILAIKDPKLRKQVNTLFYQIQLFEETINSRYKLGAKALAGSDTDKQLDAQFSQLMDDTHKLELSLKQHINKESESQNSLLILLLLTISALTTLSAFTLWRFTKNRSAYMQQLSLANEQISEQNHQLKELAHTDQLTGLPNRKMLETYTQQALSRSRRKHSFLSLTFIDLDFFKPINDQYGHNIGDKVLLNFTKAIKSELREDDLLGRLAGDEFILILQSDSDKEIQESLDKIMIRVNKRLEHPIISSPTEIHIRFSSGTALAPLDGASFNSLLHLADLAMYESKRQGRGQHNYFSHSSTFPADSIDNLTQLNPEAAIE